MGVIQGKAGAGGGEGYYPTRGRRHELERGKGGGAGVWEVRI